MREKKRDKEKENKIVKGFPSAFTACSTMITGNEHRPLSISFRVKVASDDVQFVVPTRSN